MFKSISVTALLGCPYHILNRLYTREARFAMEVGRESHRRIQGELKRMGFEVEVPVEVEYRGVKIVGKIDAVDPKNKVIYEIKSQNVTRKGFKQLLAYRDLLYLRSRELYDVGFILYRGDRIQVVKAFLYLPPPLQVWKEITQVVDLILEEGKLPRVECEDCKYCELNGECTPEYKRTANGLKRRI